MKIYQIHCYSGAWEDCCDRIVTSYLSKEKAEIELLRLQELAEKEQKCDDCPIYYCPVDCNLDCSCGECKPIYEEQVKKSCSDYEPLYIEGYDNDFGCKNFAVHDDVKYEIREVEVIE